MYLCMYVSIYLFHNLCQYRIMDTYVQIDYNLKPLYFAATTAPASALGLFTGS